MSTTSPLRNASPSNAAINQLTEHPRNPLPRTATPGNPHVQETRAQLDWVRAYAYN
jgi:hypothetical protein